IPAPGHRARRLRQRLSTFWYSDRVAVPTPSEYAELTAGHGHGHGDHDEVDHGRDAIDHR
ncbi:MAG: hypothetical protein ACT4QG_13025, partial [Sporichthyaceae bacterium]